MTEEERNAIDDSVRTAYMVALTAQHQSCSIQIHIGTDVRDYLKSLATIPDAPAWAAGPTMFGFPLVIDEAAPPKSIAVHSVRRIA